MPKVVFLQRRRKAKISAFEFIRQRRFARTPFSGHYTGLI
jgi:hypothetical protein